MNGENKVKLMQYCIDRTIDIMKREGIVWASTDAIILEANKLYKSIMEKNDA